MTKTLFCFLIIITSFSSIAQKSVQVKYISQDINIDAILDEAAWENATPASKFWQYFPTDTIQAKNQTEISMLYDDQKLYVGIKVYSSDDNYVIPSLRRDFRAGGSDNITLMFDTFNDGTTHGGSESDNNSILNMK